MGRLLTLIDKARRNLAIAKTTDTVLKIRDQAEQRRGALKAFRASIEAQNECGEIVVYAEQKLGHLIRAQKELGALSRGGRPRKTGDARGPVLATLAEAGIDKHLSSRAQKLAAMGQGVITTIQRIVAQGGPVTPQRVIRLARQQQPPSQFPRANLADHVVPVCAQRAARALWDLGFAVKQLDGDYHLIAKRLCDDDRAGVAEHYRLAFEAVPRIVEAWKMEQARRDAKAAEKEKAKTRPSYLKPVD